MIAPKGSSKLASFKPVKTCDYTSGEGNVAIYSIIIFLNQQMYNILIEPDEEMIAGIRPWMGSKFSQF